MLAAIDIPAVDACVSFALAFTLTFAFPFTLTFAFAFTLAFTFTFTLTFAFTFSFALVRFAAGVVPPVDGWRHSAAVTAAPEHEEEGQKQKRGGAAFHELSIIKRVGRTARFGPGLPSIAR